MSTTTQIAWILLLLCPLLDAVYNKTGLLIMPFSHTHRGYIGKGKVCPPKTVAVGFRMKIQMPEDVDQFVEAEAELISAEERKDFSALNAVRLLCSDDSEAISAEGLRGKWTELMRCQGKRDYIHGVRLKSEPWKGWAVDDVGATNFEAECKSGAKLSHAGLSRHGRGEWGPIARCPPEAPAVCGIKTRIDGLIDNSRGRGRGRSKILKSMMLVHQVQDAAGDSAGLTQLQLKCCQI